MSQKMQTFQVREERKGDVTVFYCGNPGFFTFIFFSNLSAFERTNVHQMFCMNTEKRLNVLIQVLPGR